MYTLVYLLHPLAKWFGHLHSFHASHYFIYNGVIFFSSSYFSSPRQPRAMHCSHDPFLHCSLSSLLLLLQHGIDRRPCLKASVNKTMTHDTVSKKKKKRKGDSTMKKWRRNRFRNRSRKIIERIKRGDARCNRKIQERKQWVHSFYFFFHSKEETTTTEHEKDSNTKEHVPNEHSHCSFLLQFHCLHSFSPSCKLMPLLVASLILFELFFLLFVND